MAALDVMNVTCASRLMPELSYPADSYLRVVSVMDTQCHGSHHIVSDSTQLTVLE